MEKALEKAAESPSETQGEADPNIVEAEEVLRQDQLFRTLVVQRSRAYVKKSMKLEGNGDVLFPKPSPNVSELLDKASWVRPVRKVYFQPYESN